MLATPENILIIHVNRDGLFSKALSQPRIETILPNGGSRDINLLPLWPHSVDALLRCNYKEFSSILFTKTFSTNTP